MTNNHSSSSNEKTQPANFPYDAYFVEAFQNGSITPDFAPEKVIIHCEDILKLDNNHRRYLLNPLLPVTGCAVFAGMGGIGKSNLSRQFAISVGLGLPEFLGYKLSLVHKRCLLVLTEDDRFNVQDAIKKQLKGMNTQKTPDISFVYADVLNQQETLLAVDESLKKSPCDLVIFDCFMDLWNSGADGNSNQAARSTIRSFDFFAKKNQTLFWFVTHIVKSAHKASPSQNQILGAGAIVQRCRYAGMLNVGQGDTRYFSTVKANYAPADVKETAIELEFDEKSLLFNPTGKLIEISMLDTEETKMSNMEKLQALAEEIFKKESLSYKEYCSSYQKITGKALSSATRDHSSMKKLEIIRKDGRKWTLNS